MRTRRSDEKEKQLPFAKKSFGQNFLTDPNYISKIINALDARAGQTIIEIGPGRGALTARLVESGAEIVAIELDKDLTPLLREKFVGSENFTIFEQDALTVDFGKLSRKPQENTKIAANLPYYISTAILQHLIGYRESFSEMILMLQKEVVERITAAPGNKERGYLTVLIEAFFNSEKLFDVPPNAFRPAPKVQSSVVRLITKKDTQIMIENFEMFKKMISAGFRQKRKTILNNLKNASEIMYKSPKRNVDPARILAAAGIDHKRRAESLTLDEWTAIANVLEAKNE